MSSPVVDIDDLPPMSERQARELDDKIKAAAATVADNIRTLLELLEHAAVGRIDIALGYPNLAAYWRQIAPHSRSRLQTLIADLRAVADMLGGPP
jgi:hypothetical protein